MGRHALDLGALAVGPVELLDRQLEGAAVGRGSPAVAAADMVADQHDLWTVPLPKVLESPMIRPRP